MVSAKDLKRYQAEEFMKLLPHLERILAFSFLFASGAVMAQSVGMLAMANPASAHCASAQGGSLYLMTDSKTGGQYGLCRINPKEAYEEWCLYRKDMNIDTKDCPNLIILLKDEK
jgi:putative hemolysin